jgi:AraC-like DNA-binding protein
VNSIARRRLDRQGAYVRATSETIADIPEDIIPDNAYDRNFMKDLYAILDKHLIQEEIDINAIVQDIGMSRTGFYMKVKALTGRSPLQLVNEYRMSKAADLLKSGKHSIKEVAFMVGYQERRSFTSRFKATFGHTPTEFLNQRLKSSE